MKTISKKALFIALFFVAYSNSYAQDIVSSVNSSISNVTKKLQNLNLSSSLLIDSSTDGSLEGTSTLLMPSLNYSLNQNNTFNIRLYNFISTENGLNNPVNTLDTIQMRYTLSKILSEKDNGLNLSMQLRASMPASIELRNKRNNDSYYDALLMASKNLNSKVSLSSTLRTTLYNFRDDSKDGRKLRNMIFLTPSVSLSKNYSLSLTNYLINSIFTSKSSTNLMVFEPSLSTSLSKNIGLSIYASLLYGNFNSDRFLVDNILNQGTYGISLSTKLF